MKQLKLLFSVTLIAILLTSCEQKPKYVFYMIGDGMGINQVLGTQYYYQAKGVENYSVNFFNFPVRTFVTTFCSDAKVTDSAAAGTALATGHKTNSQFMGVNPEGEPMENLSEKAKALGYGAGVVTSVGVNHATPAAFYAHTGNRNNYDEIMHQLFASNLDVAAGAGFNRDHKVRLTAEEYIEQAKAAGMEVFCGNQEIETMNTSNRVLLLGDDFSTKDAMAYSIDQPSGYTTLADLTKAAVKHLSANYPKGFFLMVEGGNIDHAAHSNDGASVFQDVDDFTKAIDVALDFYRAHPKQTLIVVTADHETGGLLLGAGKYSMDPVQLTYQTMSQDVISAKLKAMEADKPTWDEVKAFLGEALGLYGKVEVDAATDQLLQSLYYDAFVKDKGENVRAWYSTNSKLAVSAVNYVNRVAGYQWSYDPHSGTPVGLYAIGAGAEAFASCKDNTDIPTTIAKLAGYSK